MKFFIHILATVIAGIWGTTYVVTKILLSAGLQPADIFFYRFFLAYLLIWPLCKGKVLADSRRDEMLFLAAGLTGGSMYFLAENTALQFAQASDVAILVSACPIWTSIVLAMFYRSERLSPRQWGGVLIAFVGVCLVVFNGQMVLHLSPMGYTLALLSGLLWAFYQLCTKPILLSGRYSSWFITRKVFFYGLLTIMPYFFIAHPLNTDTDVLLKPEVVGSFLGLVIVANVGCYALWNKVMRELGAVKSSFYIYLSPAFTMIVAYLLLGESITVMALAGLVVLVFGMVLAEKRK